MSIFEYYPLVWMMTKCSLSEIIILCYERHRLFCIMRLRANMLCTCSRVVRSRRKGWSEPRLVTRMNVSADVDSRRKGDVVAFAATKMVADGFWSFYA